MFDGRGKWGLLPGEERPEIENHHTPQSSAEDRVLLPRLHKHSWSGA